MEGEPRDDARRWGMLALLSLAVLLGMSVWFTASAVSPLLRAEWGLSASQVGWLTTLVQLGFVAGTAAAAVLNLADILPARGYFAATAVLAAAANLAVLLAPSYELVLAFRFLTGFFLAGVYPTAMKMAATWFLKGRGVAIGTVVGALTLGKAAPFLMGSLEGWGLPPVVTGASLGAVGGALLVLMFYRPGPHAFLRKPFSWDLVGVVARHRPTRLAIWGYLGHMWELYAFWSAVVLFLAGHLAAQGADQPESGAAFWTFVVIAVGGLGAIHAGRLADRVGREAVASGALLVSGALALGVGWLLAAPSWVVLPLLLVWGYAVVADSAQFSALVTEVSPSHAVGTALTLQTSLGFLLTMVTIQGTPVLAEVAGWGWAFAFLAPGPLVGLWAMARLHQLRADAAPGA